MAQSTNISYEKYISITRFVIRHLTALNQAERGGVPGKTLILLCQDEFCPTDDRDAESTKREKELIADAIKQMVKEGILEPNKSSHGVVFGLQHGLKFKGFMEDKEHGWNGEGDSRAFEGAGEATPEGQLRRERDAMRHMEAYAQMTKGAVPLLRNTSEPLPETPSRKRRRVEQIAASDTSSSFDFTSPPKYHNSAPRLPLKRICSPQSDPRRQSAPTRMLNSPARAGWKPMQNLEDLQIAMKQEKQYNSPAWIISLVDSIRSKYPDSSFGSENDRAKCFDCAGRTFSLGPQRSISNFERHLNSKGHQINVNAKSGKCEPPLNMFMSTGLMSLDFQPPEPPAVFAYRGQTSLKESRNRYFQELENEGHSKEIRLSFVESRVAVSEKQNTAKIEQLSESFNALLDRSEQQIQDVTESFKTAQEASGSQIKEITGRLSGYERRTTDRLQDVEESVSNFSKTTEGFEKGTVELRRTAADLKNSTAAFEEKIQDKVANFSGKLDSVHQKSEERVDLITERLGKSERKIRIQADRMDDMIGKLGSVERLTQKIKTLEEVNEKQTEYIHDLELQFQMHKDDFQRQRQMDETLQKATSDRIESNFGHNADRFALLETETEARMNDMEESVAQRFISFDNATAEKMKRIEMENTRRIRSLKQIIDEQNEKLGRFESLFPMLIEDSQELRHFVEEAMSGRRSTSRSMSRRASIRRPKIRHVSRRMSATSSR